jgi:putative transposase
LANLGHDISDQTVGNILKAHGIEPVPERKRQTTWKTFIQSYWDVLLGNVPILADLPPPEPLATFHCEDVVCHETLGGLLKHYERRAA